MSRMGNYNLILQEQAEEYGFETTQDALDAGYMAVDDVLIPPISLQNEPEGGSDIKNDNSYYSHPKPTVESVLDGLDATLSYLRGADNESAKEMADFILKAEQFLTENFKALGGDEYGG